jgi:hypothetical protein
MAEDGIDITAQTPKFLTTDAVRASDVVITMGCGDTCPIFPGKRYEDWALDDPAGKGVESLRPIRDDIKTRGSSPCSTHSGSRRRLGGSAHGHFTSSTVPLHSGFRAHETLWALCQVTSKRLEEKAVRDLEGTGGQRGCRHLNHPARRMQRAPLDRVVAQADRGSQHVSIR